MKLQLLSIIVGQSSRVIKSHKLSNKLEKIKFWNHEDLFVREILKINFHLIFPFISFSGILYVSHVTHGYVNFIGQDQTFICEGNDARWILPNRTQIAANNTKFLIETVPGIESKLLIKNVSPRDIGPYRCVSDKVDKNFDLQVYC